MKSQALSNTTQAINKIETYGYKLFSSSDLLLAKETIKQLGKILFTTEVKVNFGSKNLVTSDRALPLHTDHHAIDYIAWQCHQQTSVGGHTLLLDTTSIIKRFSDDELDALKQIDLYEHKVFDQDKSTHPLITQTESKLFNIYFSFWLVNEQDRSHPAVKKLTQLIKISKPIKFKLQPGQLLVINNRRMLHGRTAIEGNKERHLTRHWLKAI
ncbi:TauD/TfdA family dioxygenase [Pelagibaculum spongiae]|uniref:TauD/TfdA-like domain-containing protein n=1 Tax=Pelagibaculum spongiae TaxID=2080658 RepID=A0A2V1GY53_9GAMM|nr:TauD/TfdA family dioxygenase [Pelagibaculum spongiae]PVZ72014.1 hypothetical protein DC094_03060 [Pelagibaculum spongiae]